MREVFHHGLGLALMSAVALAPIASAQAGMSASSGVRTATIGKPTETTTLSIGSGHGPVHHFYRWW